MPDVSCSVLKRLKAVKDGVVEANLGLLQECVNATAPSTVRVVDRPVETTGDWARVVASGQQAIHLDEHGSEEVRVDPLFVDSAVDFIRMYADRTHHGKEEDILFRELEKRTLSADDRRIMNELVQEHVFGRRTTKALVDANRRYQSGDAAAFTEIVDRLRSLVEFYPKHIEKEDSVFFPAARAYFSDREEQDMAAEFQEFDRRMIHEKYKAVVEGLEKR